MLFIFRACNYMYSKFDTKPNWLDCRVEHFVRFAKRKLISTYVLKIIDLSGHSLWEKGSVPLLVLKWTTLKITYWACNEYQYRLFISLGSSTNDFNIFSDFWHILPLPPSAVFYTYLFIVKFLPISDPPLPPFHCQLLDGPFELLLWRIIKLIKGTRLKSRSENRLGS